MPDKMILHCLSLESLSFSLSSNHLADDYESQNVVTACSVFLCVFGLGSGAAGARTPCLCPEPSCRSQPLHLHHPVPSRRNLCLCLSLGLAIRKVGSCLYSDSIVSCHKIDIA